MPFSLAEIWGLLPSATEGNPSLRDTHHGEIEMPGEPRETTTRIARGLFDFDFVEKMWKAHQGGKMEYHMQLWLILILEFWFRRFIDRK